MSKSSIKILAFGDVVGKPGRKSLLDHVSVLRKKYGADLVIANGENSAGGSGIDEKCATEIHNAGVDVITLGDHTWQKKEIYSYLEDEKNKCIRPANYPEGAPGKGYTILKVKDKNVAVINLIGRVFIQQFVDCPFQTVDRLLEGAVANADIIICDMHAEATSEKLAMAHYLDGRVSFVFGTHTHIQTADEQILPNGTGYITDLGMCGPKNSVLGLSTQVSIDRFITGMKHSYELGEGKGTVSGIFAEIDTDSKKTIKVERIAII